MHSQTRGPRLLVVDDDPDTLDSLWTYLTDHLPDAIVLPFPETGDALAAVSSTRPDLILADYRMPGMDGIEFLRRAHRLAPGAHQVLMTGHGIDGLDRDPSRRTTVVRKPFDGPGFLDFVRACVARAAAVSA